MQSADLIGTAVGAQATATVTVIDVGAARRCPLNHRVADLTAVTGQVNLELRIENSDSKTAASNSLGRRQLYGERRPCEY